MNGNLPFEYGCAARTTKAGLVTSELPATRIYSANTRVFRNGPRQDVRNALIIWGG